jgi:uncharacterized membrane protein YkvA (DUF1232 family)
VKVPNADAMKVRVAGWHGSVAPDRQDARAPCHHPPVDAFPLVGVVVAIVGAWALLLVVFWALRPRDVSARELARIVPDVLRLLRALIRDSAVPLDARLVLVGLVAWIVSPIDLIPEFIPVLGPLDDVVVAIVAMRYVRRRVGGDGIRARWTGSDDGFRLLTRVIGG